MQYNQMIQKVQEYSGFSADESKDSLEMMVESLAVHLPESERKEFASHLPEKLKNLALSVYATNENSNESIHEQFIKMQKVSRDRAREQMQSSWRALTEALSTGQIENIKAQLPKHTTQLLQ
jgi:uncharacterized protein (DUF2267 family)